MNALRLKTRLIKVFIWSFAGNLIWEQLHSLLYKMPTDALVRQLMLFRSTFVDAIWITALGAVYLLVHFFNKRLWLMALLGIASSAAIETLALRSGRWEYNQLMPLMPLIKTGLTPTIQIGLLFFLVMNLTKDGKDGSQATK